MKELLYVHLASVLFMGTVMSFTIKQDRDIDGHVTLMNLLKYMALTFTPVVSTFACCMFIWVVARDFIEDGWDGLIIKLRTTELFKKEVK
jgi:hypothetical protein